MQADSKASHGTISTRGAHGLARAGNVGSSRDKVQI